MKENPKFILLNSNLVNSGINIANPKSILPMKN